MKYPINLTTRYILPLLDGLLLFNKRNLEDEFIGAYLDNDSIEVRLKYVPNKISIFIKYIKYDEIILHPSYRLIRLKIPDAIKNDIKELQRGRPHMMSINSQISSMKFWGFSRYDIKHAYYNQEWVFDKKSECVLLPNLDYDTHSLFFDNQNTTLYFITSLYLAIDHPNS